MLEHYNEKVNECYGCGREIQEGDDVVELNVGTSGHLDVSDNPRFVDKTEIIKNSTIRLIHSLCLLDPPEVTIHE